MISGINKNKNKKTTLFGEKTLKSMLNTECGKNSVKS